MEKLRMISYKQQNKRKGLQISEDVRDHSVSMSESSSDHELHKRDDKHPPMFITPEPSPQPSPKNQLNMSNFARTSIGTVMEDFFNDDFRNPRLQNWSIRCFWRLKPKQREISETWLFI